jgi:hypothetical protein
MPSLCTGRLLRATIDGGLCVFHAIADPRLVPPPQHSLQTFDFQTQKFWIWVGVAYCMGLFVLFTLVSGIALRFIDPPHAQVNGHDALSEPLSLCLICSACVQCVQPPVLPAIPDWCFS